MRQILHVPKEYILKGYKQEVVKLCKEIDYHRNVENFYSNVKSNALRLAEVIETYQKISESKDDIVEVNYEAKEGV